MITKIPWPEGTTWPDMYTKEDRERVWFEYYTRGVELLLKANIDALEKTLSTMVGIRRADLVKAETEKLLYAGKHGHWHQGYDFRERRKDEQVLKKWAEDPNLKQHQVNALVVGAVLYEFVVYLRENHDELNSPKKPKKQKENEFHSLFAGNGHKVCEGVFEDLDITLNGETRLKKGRAGKLIGAIVAMKETPGFFVRDFTDKELLNFFNARLNTQYTTFAKRSHEFEAAKDDAKRYIKNHFIK